MSCKLRQPEKVYGLDFSQKEIEKAIKQGSLLSIDLETSMVCNLKCIYCYADAGKKRSKELSLKKILDVIDQAIEMGVKVISIIGGGEPLLYENLFAAIGHLYGKPIKKILFTNGTLITDEIASRLWKNEVSIVVKLNSMKPDIQDKLAGVKGTHKKIMKGIENLFKAGYPSERQPLGIETIICRQNIEELPGMWEWARERNINPYFETVTFMGRARKYNLNISSNELKYLFENLLEVDKKKFGFTWNPHPPIAGLSCKRHYYSVTVTSNGYVRPCVGVDISIGNVRYKKLREIISSSEVIKNLRNMKKNIKGQCKKCEFLYECYGCRGMAYHVLGDYFAADPLCWRNPEKVI